MTRLNQLRRWCDVTLTAVLLIIWLAYFSEATATENTSLINLGAGWQLDKTVSIQGALIGLGLLWQVGKWGRRGVSRIHEMSANAATVPEIKDRLDRIERIITKLACVKKRGCEDDDESCEGALWGTE
jgi:hypothetical protein